MLLTESSEADKPIVVSAVESTMSHLHTVKFNFGQLIVVLLFATPIVLWGINEHYSNKQFHEMQERINASHNERITNLEDKYRVIMDQHGIMMGKIETVIVNQQIVLEALTGVQRQNYGIRKAMEDSAVPSTRRR